MNESKDKNLVAYVLVRPDGKLAETALISDNIDYMWRVYEESLTRGYRIAKVCEVLE